MSMPNSRQRARIVGKCSDEFRALVRNVEVDAVDAVLLDLEVDGARDDIAWGELGTRIVARHEALAIGQLQQAAFAAHRLRDQERLGMRVEEAGGVELDEFHVGNCRSGTPAHGHPVARRGIGVGRVQVDLPAARREDGSAPERTGPDFRPRTAAPQTRLAPPRSPRPA
jgi:hypothetical protein